MNRSATAALTRTMATSSTMPMLPPRWLRSTVFGRDLLDLQRDPVGALGHADRRVHAALVLQRHGVVGRVGDDDRGLGDRGHHAPAAALHADLPDLGLDGRVAFRVLELLLHF